MREPTTIDPEGGLEEVLNTTDSTLLPVVKSLLDSAGIPHLVQGETTQGLFPMPPIPITRGRTGLGARLLVPKEFVDEARALLSSFTEPEDPDASNEPS